MHAILRQSLSGARSFISTRPLGAAGAMIILLMALAALFADVLAPYDPLETDYGAMLQAPGIASLARHRLLRSRRAVARSVRLADRVVGGVLCVLCGTSIGAMIGVSCAYFGGRFDLLTQRLMDILLSFPLIVLALVVVAVLGSGIWNVILAISIPMIPRAALVVRSSALALRQMLFVEAALTLGSSHWRIISRHMLPNVMAPYLIMLSAFLGQAILLEASLSFLGLGVAEPTAAWGLMLRGAAVEFAERAPWMALFPGSGD